MSEPANLRAAYQHGHHPSVVADHAKRTAEGAASFFLPFLEPGMRLLDVGCGPGSITSGLAQRVAPGETIGIDPSPSVIETARALAGGAPHLNFELATSISLDSARKRSTRSLPIRSCSISADLSKRSRRSGSY
jgi:2-polyprenyl-3-methyl-5-hydroxy-6-metoxy-1,4-benzoquinol methylase